MARLKYSRGYTLLELAVVVAAALIVTSIVAGLAMTQFRSQQMNQVSADLLALASNVQAHFSSRDRYTGLTVNYALQHQLVPEPIVAWRRISNRLGDVELAVHNPTGAPSNDGYLFAITQTNATRDTCHDLLTVLFKESRGVGRYPNAAGNETQESAILRTGSETAYQTQFAAARGLCDGMMANTPYRLRFWFQ